METAVDNEKQWDKWLQHLELLQRNNEIEDGWISVKVTHSCLTLLWFFCAPAIEEVIAADQNDFYFDTYTLDMKASLIVMCLKKKDYFDIYAI